MLIETPNDTDKGEDDDAQSRRDSILRSPRDDDSWSDYNRTDQGVLFVYLHFQINW